MQVKITRREWAAALAASAAPALAQTPSSERQASADEMLAEARSDARRDASELRKFVLPPATEPAFVFKP
jgi:hypothetical protein